MSCCEIYAIQQNGDVMRYAEERNACAGALVIWMDLAKKYNVSCNVLDFKPIWDFCNEFKMNRQDTIAMISTYDRIWIAREHLKEVADAWDKMWEWVDQRPRDYKTDDTIRRVAKVLRQAADDDTIRGICFNHTSVSSNPWRVRIDEEESRPFNFNTDKTLTDGGEPWELYDWLKQYDDQKR